MKTEKFECSGCDGKGYITKWEHTKGKKEEPEDLVIEDCDCCKGTGKVDIIVIDNRKISKKRKLEYIKIF